MAVGGQAGRQLQLASCSLFSGQLLAGLDHTSQASCYTVGPCYRLYQLFPRKFHEDKAHVEYGNLLQQDVGVSGHLLAGQSSVQLLTGQRHSCFTKQLVQY